MWWIKGNADPSRGGFQNRDVGRTNFDHDFGPEFGVDYARFSDPPDFSADHKLTEIVKSHLARFVPKLCEEIEIKVRNGFVILEGEVNDPALKEEVTNLITPIPSVREVINQLHIQV